MKSAPRENGYIPNRIDSHLNTNSKPRRSKHKRQMDFLVKNFKKNCYLKFRLFPEAPLNALLYGDDKEITAPTTVRWRQKHYFTLYCTGPLQYCIQYCSSIQKKWNRWSIADSKADDKNFWSAQASRRQAKIISGQKKLQKFSRHQREGSLKRISILVVPAITGLNTPR